jgi:hypothetical protein
VAKQNNSSPAGITVNKKNKSNHERNKRGEIA